MAPRASTCWNCGGGREQGGVRVRRHQHGRRRVSGGGAERRVQGSRVGAASRQREACAGHPRAPPENGGGGGQRVAHLVDGGAGDVAVGVEEQGEVLQLLAHDEAQGGQHGHAAVGDLRLPPAADLHPQTSSPGPGSGVRRAGGGRRGAGAVAAGGGGGGGGHAGVARRGGRRAAVGGRRRGCPLTSSMLAAVWARFRGSK